MAKYFGVNEIFLLLLIVVVFIYFLRKGRVNKMNFQELKQRIDDGTCILVDVRTHGEYLERHIPGSTLIPLNILHVEAENKLKEKGKEIYVYCQSGGRSAKAAYILSDLGYSNVRNLGSIMNWPYEMESGNK